ncbi:MAG: acyltransferase domain-containing protein [Propionibacteriaceae bacterium]
MMTLREACRWFDLDDEDADEVMRAADGIRADEQLDATLAGVVKQFREHMEQLPPWNLMNLPPLFDPVVDPEAPAAVRWLYVVAFAQVLPETLAVHVRRGVPEETSRATLADVGRHVRIARRLYGVRACIEQHWLQAHLRGILYDLGRLQFNLARLELSQAELDEAGIDATPGTVVLETHIPESGPLDPAAADASFARAQEFFAAHFPELGTIRYATCDSWLLDPQLSRIVPGSNIVRFGERYRLFRTARESDQSALDFVFRAPTTPRDQLPRETRLQRGLLDHLAGDGHIEARYGWLELPSTSTV